ncbi:Maf family protein [Membranicola marinus]|uniref:dTTP/UTP pyrophosphatase n=1 Tax=Membranihabitans marinus TaxID=1227546 RepID=A0A953LC13_9BACT|nr:Maf family protein [Membranihabitans marinus]MBY5957284.1 Maf family protein [Membranihabitans marinus]
MIPTPIVLASSSPRRFELLQSLDLNVRVVNVSHTEIIEKSWPTREIPLQLAIQKNRNAIDTRQQGEILLTADTVVLLDNEILHKPGDELEAAQYLSRLSHRHHEVITGVCLRTEEEICFSTTTKVWMNKLSDEAIHYYIDRYQPFDKAGSYGIQEWIGWSHISRIEGSFSNVMGLPTSEVYQAVRDLNPML